MQCQLVSTLETGRRTRGIHAYPMIWSRAVSRYVRWYLTLSVQLLGVNRKADRGRALSPPHRCADERRLRVGDWVRVKSRAEIEAQQQGADVSDVVAFIPAPMSRYCGRTLRVLRVLDHYYDELREGLCRAENAVLLEGATCDSSQLGSRRCERGCLHFWKESWLERTTSPDPVMGNGTEEPSEISTGRRTLSPDSMQDDTAPGAQTCEFQTGEAVRVRDPESIAKTLDGHGCCDGVPFVPEHMNVHCGRIFIVSKVITRFFDEKADYMINLPRSYMLGGVYCDGRQTGDEPYCDRGCALVWHGMWLERVLLEPVGDECND